MGLAGDECGILMPQFVLLSCETVLITSVAGNFFLCFLDGENPLFEKLAILSCYNFTLLKFHELAFVPNIL